MSKIIAFTVPEDIYEELKRRAERRGYTLLSDYVRSIVMRELGYGDESEKIRELVRSEIQRLISEKGGIEVEPIDTDKLLEKIMARLRRQLQDMVNPWTAKIDQLQARLAELQEKLESLEEKLQEAEARERIASRERRELQAAYSPIGFQQDRREHRHGRRRSAIDRLREQGIVYEHDVQWLRDRDAFFEKLRREGAIILEVGGERIAIDPVFWSNFKEKLEAIPTANEDEIKILLTNQQYELFRRLKEAGMIYFDASKKSWRLTENVERGRSE